MLVSSKRIKIDSLLLEMLLPNASCSDGLGPASRLIGGGRSSPEALVLVAPFGSGAHPADAMNKMFDALTSSSRLAPTSQRELTRSKTDEYFEFKSSEASTITHKRAWRSSKDRRSFIVCDKGGSNPHPPRVERCRHLFVHRDLLFRASYGSDWASQWHTIEMRSRERFDQFAGKAASWET